MTVIQSVDWAVLAPAVIPAAAAVAVVLAVIVVAALVLADGSAEVRPFDMREINGIDLRGAAALTLFALLELYKQGEANWTQEIPFGEITINAREAA